MDKRIKAPQAAGLLVGGWTYQIDKPRVFWRTAWIRAEGAPVASVRVTVDLDETVVRLKVVDERILQVPFPVETVRHDIPNKDLFESAEELLLDAACAQLRSAAAQTVREVPRG